MYPPIQFGHHRGAGVVRDGTLSVAPKFSANHTFGFASFLSSHLHFVLFSSAFGDALDLHSGGIDLQFPHHDNEIHQCEAHCAVPGKQWCRVFMHTGNSNFFH
jgi:hypothetical protein